MNPHLQNRHRRKYSKTYNLVWDAGRQCLRVVCAHCRVPLDPVEGGVDIGKDFDNRRIFICRDCQRDVTDDTVLPRDSETVPEDDPFADLLD